MQSIIYILGAVSGFFPTMLGYLGDIPKAIMALGQLNQIILDAEASGEDGPTKMAKVLNDFEVFLNTLSPALGTDFKNIQGEVEAAVNAIVAFYNAFANAKPTT